MEQHVGHSTLAGLAVDADHRLVATAQVPGIDGQVGDVPDAVLARHGLPGSDVVERGHALLDGVLVAAGEGGVDQIADVRMALGDRHPIRELEHPAGLLDVADVQLRVDTLGEKVQGEGDHVDIAGSLAVSEQGSLDPIGSGHDAELGRRDRGAAIVVGVKRQHDRVAVANRAVEALDEITVEIGGRHLDRGRQVEDQRPIRRRFRRRPSPPRRPRPRNRVPFPCSSQGSTRT